MLQNPHRWVFLAAFESAHIGPVDPRINCKRLLRHLPLNGSHADCRAARIAALYRIKAEIRGKDPAQRLAERQQRSRPLVTDLRLWFEAQLKTLPARGPTAEVIRYHWDGLERYLLDGRIEIDNNTAERSMRPVKLSAKNSLFAGSDEGAENWAAVASLVETCKLNGINPQTYFTDLLTRLVNNWPQAKIDELMPWCWKKSPQP